MNTFCWDGDHSEFAILLQEVLVVVATPESSDDVGDRAPFIGTNQTLNKHGD
jgi:hypothetical protein